MSEYTVNIEMKENTVNELIDGNFQLYAFRAVKGPTGGKPVVWFTTGDILQSTEISWETDYGAFISIKGNTPGKNGLQISNNAEISSRTDKPIELGQKMVVSEKGKVDVVEGTPDTISIYNNHDRDYTCGISEKKDDKFNPLCAFPLARTITDLITPISKIALMFATQTVKTATVVEKAIGPGILLDLTAEPSRDISYSLDTKWKADNKGPKTVFNSDDPLNPLLINPAK
jgi:hypothetical protein